jgi:exodeoxyribonuclease V beta subunit
MSPPSFQPTAPLPTGRVLLEASAGTGKTWTIAALVARYVAEAGVPIDEMLVVTFTRAATSELRERTRSRLVEAARYLRHPFETDDEVLHHLADCDPAERAVRRRRLEHALRGFDRATITTLHGLAHRFLVEMGLLARTSPPREVVGDEDELVAQVLNDIYVATFASSDQPLSLGAAHEIARAVAATPDAEIIPAVGELAGDGDVRACFAHDIRRRLTERARSGRVTSYDGLLLSARDAVVHPDSGTLAAARLRRRYRVALIDEFQDTDGIQWQTVDAVFGDVASTMILIGDPKQSIYAFRGADIGAYLDASGAASTTYTLTTNWRSDGPLLEALDVVFSDVRFGDDRIPYRTVSPAPRRSQAGIRQVAAPLVIRAVGLDAPVSTVGGGTLSVPAARGFIARDAAAYVVDLLSRPAELTGDGGWRPIRPGDIAVLCRTRHEVDQVRNALAVRRVPSVVGRTGNVLLSEAADAWLTLLEAFESPSSAKHVRAAALTPFFGWNPVELASAADDDLLPLHETAGSPRCGRRSKRAKASPAGCCPARTGSGSSPTWPTSPR